MTVKPDNAARNERIRQLQADGKSRSQIAEEMELTEGIVAGVLSKKRDKDNARKRQARAAKHKPASTPADESAPPAPPPLQPATEAEVKRVAARYLGITLTPFDDPHVAPHGDGWLVVVPLADVRSDAPGDYRLYNVRLYCPTEEALAACRRWMREADLEGPVDAGLGQEDRVPYEEFPVHPAANLLPLLGDEELRELAADIQKEPGLLEPITVYEGQILDGRNRLAACKLAGRRPVYQWVYDGDLGEGGPLGYVLSKNLHRRHLTNEQKRAVVAAMLQADPSRSNRQIAEQVGVDHKTVGAVRQAQEATGEIPQLARAEGKDGRVRSRPQRARGRTETPRAEAAAVEPTEASPEASASPQSQGQLPFAEPLAPPTPTPYPEMPAAPPPVAGLGDRLAAWRASTARVEQLLTRGEPTESEEAADILEAIDQEHEALSLLQEELFARLCGVPADDGKAGHP
jgi:transposase